MLDNVPDEVVSGLINSVIQAITRQMYPFARPHVVRGWRWFRDGIASDYARFKALSRRRKIIAVVFNLYVVAALATGSAFDSDAAPFAVQAWVATLPLIIIGGWSWLGNRGATRRVRRVLARPCFTGRNEGETQMPATSYY